MAHRNKRRQKKQQKKFSRSMQGVALAMLANQLLLPLAAQAATPVMPGFYGKVNLPSVAADQLPQLKTGGLQSNASVSTSGSAMTVTQTAARAIIDWAKFDVGVSASVYFSQKQNGVAQTGWAALNRIYDTNPSQIYGNLKADGRIYLLNQNGTLFGPGSKVDVHTLVASSLKMDLQKLISTASGKYSDDPANKTDLDIWSDPGRFLDETTSLNLTRFTRESWNGQSGNLYADGGGVVANAGTITGSGTTNEQGGVFLIGGAVENHGTINAPSGQIALAAGDQVYLSPAYSASNDTLRQGALTVKVTGVTSGNDSLNESSGSLTADQGMVGMYGNRVAQNGLIRSISTVKRNGTIELLAKERITTGADSITATPLTDSSELVHSTFIHDDQGNFAYNTWISLAGLDYSSNPNLSSQVHGTSVEGIEHLGSIVAPGAKVVLKARDRVFLGEESLIDVSGSRVSLSAGDKMISTVLTSTELRDDQTQKDGILKGATVSSSTLSETSIGNLASLVALQQAVAKQWTVNAGTVEISATKGDIVMKEGAKIDISGGVTGYSSGDMGQTALVYGTKIYGLSNAPTGLSYARLLGSYTKTYSRFGIQKTYSGLWFGGANPIFNPVPAFEEGGNAGKLTLQARQLLLDGTIASSVTRGLFQTRLDEIRDSSDNALTRGLKMPDGGTLILGGYSYGGEADQMLDGVVISGDDENRTDSIAGFDENRFATPLGSLAISTISSSLLSLPGTALSDLQIYTNSTITTTADSNLALLPGGALTLRAQQVEHNGSISVSSGTVDISLLDNILVDAANEIEVTLPDPSRVLLAAGSSISTAGLVVTDPTDVRGSNYLDGGSITIKDMTEAGNGILVRPGAVLSVDAGYALDAKRAVTGGNAGSLALAGSSVDLQGIVSGKALAGHDGGTLKIHSNWMTLASQYRNVAEGTVLGTDQLLDTGFGTLDLTGVFGLTVENGVQLPATLARQGVDGTAQRTVVNDAAGLSGSMGLKLEAGKTLEYSNSGYLSDVASDGGEIVAAAEQALLTVGTGADLTIAPEGNIALKAPGVVLDGTLRSRSGSIAITASGNLDGAKDVTIGSTALLDARGYDKQVYLQLGSTELYESDPKDGGSIELGSSYGTVSMASGAVADVSGTEPVTVSVLEADGLGVASTTVAGSAGSVTVHGVSLDLQGALKAATYRSGTKGGTLDISTTNDLALTEAVLTGYLGAGFDALTFGSTNQLVLSGSMDLQISRSLTFDTPLISGTSGSNISLTAPWVSLTNTSAFTKSATAGTAELRLAGNTIDLSGSVALGGFSRSTLAAAGDISATEMLVSAAGTNAFKGELNTAGDLTLQAARVYPKNYAYTGSSSTIMIPSEYCIRSSDGSVTVLSSGGATDGYLDSAGGSLTIEAKNGINQSGYLAAPLGRIALNSTGNTSRVYLAPGSVTSTHGSAETVQVGYLNSDGKLALPENGLLSLTSPTVLASEQDLADWRGSASGVYTNTSSVSGSDQREVVQAEGALIDVSGGGGFFAYQFFPGAAGTIDPLNSGGRMVVVPQATAPLGGQTIYLAGGNGVAAGVYTIVPERYAFLSNALIVSDTGAYVAPDSNYRTTEGYAIVAGYLGVANTAVGSNRYNGYVVRPAEAVRAEGEFTTQQVTAGNGNNVSITGATILLDGTIQAKALAGYTGGSISLVGTDMTVQNSSSATTGGIDFSSAIPSELQGTVSVSSDALSGQGFSSVVLGSTTTTNTLTVVEGSSLNIDGDLTLNAKNLVAVGKDSSLSGDILTLASPTGTVTVAEGTTLTGKTRIDFEVKDDLTVQGALDTPLVNLTGENIVVHDVSGVPVDITGLSLSPTLWATLNGFNPSIGLKSRNDLIFVGNTILATAKNLTIDAARLRAYDGNSTAAVSSDADLVLKNSGDKTTDAVEPAKSGTALSIHAANITVDLSHPTVSSAANVGDISLSGFETASLQADKDLALGGNGTIASSGGLTLEAARVTTAASVDSIYQDYLPANVLVQAATTLAIKQAAGAAGTGMVPGGSLTFKAADIKQGGTIAMQSGTLKFEASNDLTFANGSETLNRGSATGAGGSIVATATNGKLDIKGAVVDEQGKVLQKKALLDVSAGSQGDVGSISLTAVPGGVTVGADTVKGSGTTTGGSFSMDSKFIDDSSTTTVNELTPLLTTLANGGFTEQINLRVRTGDLTVADSSAGAEITARKVSLAADGGTVDTVDNVDGNLTLQGQIDTGSGKGLVELFADKNLTMAAGSSVTVTGGGEVNLGSSSGILTLAGADTASGKAKALLDLSNGNGTVNLRALRDPNLANGVKMALDGEIRGASEVNVEAVQVYKGVEYKGSTSIVSISNADYDLDDDGKDDIDRNNNIVYWQQDTNDYMANATDYRTNLLADPQNPLAGGLSLTDSNGTVLSDTGLFHFRPGVEAQSSGAMTLGTALDLTGWRYTVNGKSETGVLTLRAADNLSINATIDDKPTTSSGLHSSTMQNSWNLRLVAGAGGADPLGTTDDTGILTVTGGVYTENGDISFASGADTIINTANLSNYLINNSLKYTVASYGGTIRGEVGNNLLLNAGVIQSSVGDIDLSIAGNLNLSGSSSLMGAIRTTGEAASTAAMTRYYTYGNGGELRIAVGGDISSTINSLATVNPWDFATSVRVGSVMTPYWHADYATSGGLRGIAAMAGGDVTVRSGGDLFAQIGSFAPTSTSGSGNLVIEARGNLNGRFLSGRGDALLTTQGAFGSGDDSVPVVSAVYTGTIDVNAQADVLLGTVDNPTITHPGYSTVYKKWELTYLPESILNITSHDGDIILTGTDRFYSNSSNSDHGERRLLPASLHMQAAGDIILQNSFVLAPSATAELTMTAGGDIIGSAGANSLAVGSRIIMSDLNPSEVYGAQSTSLAGSPITALLSYTQTHSTELTEQRHAENPVIISAGGAITDLELDLTKRVEISAGGAITDLHYVGQNIEATDVSSIMAGGDIVLNTAGLEATDGVYLHSGFLHGGPGTFLVQAGGTIDLGGTRGIQTYGNHQNAALAESGSDLFLLAGVMAEYGAAETAAFFNDLKAGAQEYSRIKADTGSDEASRAAAVTAAAEKLEELRTNLINPFLENSLDESGTINMVSSQISTLTGNSINIMTGGAFNVGKSTFYSGSKQKNTGVYTAQGGDINVFSRGDVDVKESRLMTFYGGDITVWSDEGIINAGRGSKTAINPSQALKVMRDDGSYITRFSPPSVGSGVRAMTYNAGDGGVQPEAGDVTLVARVVDAGEAGIFGGKVFIGADEVLNAANISSVGVSVGVPTQTDSSAGLGALSGSGTLNEGSRMLVDAAAVGNRELAAKAALAADNFITAWLDVKVMGFDENPPE